MVKRNRREVGPIRNGRAVNPPISVFQDRIDQRSANDRNSGKHSSRFGLEEYNATSSRRNMKNRRVSYLSMVPPKAWAAVPLKANSAARHLLFSPSGAVVIIFNKRCQYVEPGLPLRTLRSVSVVLAALALEIHQESTYKGR